MATIDDLKVMLDFNDVDEARDKRLNIIIKNAESALLVRLHGQKSIPDALSYIVVELSIVRFNRIGNEGMKTFQQEGESIAYDLTDDLTPYTDAINGWLNSQEDPPGKSGMVQFL